jgi:hypothetical protein
VGDSALRPAGTVERECSICTWRTWHEPLSREATILPFVCSSCVTNPEIHTTCAACNRRMVLRHRELLAQDPSHPRCGPCALIPPGQFAETVYCWALDFHARTPGDRCPNVATQIKRHIGNTCDCPACWQKFYHLCDIHAEQWINDLPEADQKVRFKAQGATIIELTDPPGGWMVQWPSTKQMN